MQSSEKRQELDNSNNHEGDSYFSKFIVRKVGIYTDKIVVKPINVVEKSIKIKDKSYLESRYAFKKWCLDAFSNVSEKDVFDVNFQQKVMKSLIYQSQPMTSRDGFSLPRAFLSVKILEDFGYIHSFSYTEASTILPKLAYSMLDRPWMIRKSCANLKISNIDVLVIAYLNGDTYTPSVPQYRYINLYGVGWFELTTTLEAKIKSSTNPARDIIFDIENNKINMPDFVCIYDLIQYAMELQHLNIKGLVSMKSLEVLKK